MTAAVLDMLAGCPDGATEGALAAHGFDRAMLDKLVDEGKVVSFTQTYAHGQTVMRFRKAEVKLPKVATACWFARLPPEYVKIGVSRTVPDFLTGAMQFPDLFPGGWFKSVPPEKYLELYGRVLERLDAESVLDQLTTMAGGKIPVLVCYEGAKSIHAGEKWCHRHIIAEWLEKHCGTKVPEVGHPNLDRFHFLRRQDELRAAPKQLELFAPCTKRKPRTRRKMPAESTELASAA